MPFAGVLRKIACGTGKKREQRVSGEVSQRRWFHSCERINVPNEATGGIAESDATGVRDGNFILRTRQGIKHCFGDVGLSNATRQLIKGNRNGVSVKGILLNKKTWQRTGDDIIGSIIVSRQWVTVRPCRG